jgi:antitoxin (DNA-binding transcriptional repressor) of toxin-antitoxin stability system
MSEFESPIRDVRDNLAAIVDRADNSGATTYITRRGERVAAIVPLNQTGRTRESAREEREHLRPMPAAAGGTFVTDSTNIRSGASREELDWTRAALEALHLRLNAATAELVALTGVTGRALAALSEEHLGTVKELMDSIDLNTVNSEVYEAEELHQALSDLDDAHCQTCGSPLGFFQGYSGWQHYQFIPSDLGGQKLEITEPDHPTVERWEPRQRPAITNGTVEATGLSRTQNSNS